MSLSSSSIIHFTSSKNSLKGILQDNFRIKFCLENIILGGISKPYAAPMVSFCDIPLSEIKLHIEKYGNYGIGLTKEWAIRQGLNPVIYIEKNSFFSQSLFESIIIANKSRRKSKSAKINSKNDYIANHLMTVISYIKNYENDLYRKKKKYPNYRFSDEREWRYVPNPAHMPNFTILTQEHYEDPEAKTYYKSELEHLRLTFEPNDIKYIIVKDESEISEFINFLRDVKGKIYTIHEIERLSTRILTSEQIKSDF